jgi:ADP-L-glycero-D-manno-heptose 6-epimerase
MIVVTGGAGFIGSNVVASLDERGRGDIVVCDRLGDDERWRNLAKHEIADMVAPEALIGYLDDHAGEVEAIIHMGANSSTTETDADAMMASNFGASLALWHWCAANGKRLIYASSAATYGDGAEGFDDDGSIEALARLRPLNLYGFSKHLFDRRVARLVAEGAPAPTQWVGLKFFNVYGPNEFHKGAMMSLVTKNHARAAKGEAVTLFRSHHPDYADGGQRRDFVYVKDCVDAMLWLLDNPRISGLFNMGTGRAQTFLELVTALFEACGTKPDIHYVDTPPEIREKYQYFTEAGMGRLRQAGYDAPFRTIEEGVADYVASHLSQADPYR